ncbi:MULTISPECIES: hypothetical protein [Actinoplanes]|uniref:hypothetical protein n=1 Tax=Actinoplanes TaxID=1865 RepID=UPI00069797B4|nr:MULTISPECIES: hypothetical protein [Actinoplanes]GLY03927.1 hypothetical protein Acsp01_43060 [Actinoplanes sp. NBRC 101535]
MTTHDENDEQPIRPSLQYGWIPRYRPAGVDRARPALAAGDGSAPPTTSPGSRWTLALAVLASAALISTTVLILRPGAASQTGSSSQALPERWVPPAMLPASPSEIPLPSAPASSAPTSDAPLPIEDEPEPTTRPPSSRPPAVAASVNITRALVPAVVDVDDQGTRDWVHFGLSSATSVNRRAGGTGEIKGLGGVGERGRYDNNPETFRWIGGTPTSFVGATTTGLYTCDSDGTFTLSVAATPSRRTLRLYAGVWMARARLTATVAGRTATAELENREAISTAQWVIRFQAAAGQTLRLTWATTAQFHPSCGNIDIQAVTLS